MNTFYTYIYLDILKPGHYEYKEFVFSHEPIYVGLGTKNRLNIHLIKAKNKTKKTHSPNPHFIHRIRKMLEANSFPIIHKLQEDMSKEEAFSSEKMWISCIGRRDLKKGPLLNMTDGGEGTGEWTEQRKRAFKEKMSGDKNPFFGKRHPKEIMLRRTYTPLSEEDKRKKSKSAKRAIAEGRLKLPDNRGKKNAFYGVKPVKAIAGKIIKTLRNLGSLKLELTEDNYNSNRVSKSCPKWSRIEEYMSKEEISVVYSTALEESYKKI